MHVEITEAQILHNTEHLHRDASRAFRDEIFSKLCCFTYVAIIMVLTFSGVPKSFIKHGPLVYECM